MNENEIRYLGDVQKLELKPSDVIVIQMDYIPSKDDGEAIKKIFEGVFGEERRVLILPRGISLTVMSQVSA